MSPTVYHKIEFDICQSKQGLMAEIFYNIFSEDELSTILIKKNQEDCPNPVDDSLNLFKHSTIELFGIIPFPSWLLKKHIPSEHHRLITNLSEKGEEYIDTNGKKFKIIHKNYLPESLYDGEEVIDEFWNIIRYYYTTPCIYYNYINQFYDAYRNEINHFYDVHKDEVETKESSIEVDDKIEEKFLREIINTKINIPIPEVKEPTINDWNEYWGIVGKYYGRLWFIWKLILKTPTYYEKKIRDFNIRQLESPVEGTGLECKLTPDQKSKLYEKCMEKDYIESTQDNFIAALTSSQNLPHTFTPIIWKIKQDKHDRPNKGSLWGFLDAIEAKIDKAKIAKLFICFNGQPFDVGQRTKDEYYNNWKNDFSTYLD